jgi:hypothetical protein
MKSITLVAATALAGALLVVSPAAKADVIFGNLTPSPACGPVLGVGSVCGPSETFTGSFGEQVLAQGFLGAPGTSGATNLTLKPVAGNGLAESGLGIQNTPNCTTSDCEILPPQSVSVTRLDNTQITAAQIGSVQVGETFNFFTQNTAGGAFTLLAANVTNTCMGAGFSVAGTDLCQWNAPAGQFRFGVAVQAVATAGAPLGDILLVSVSSVPGPIVGAGLPGLVAACGGLIALARRRRRQIV